MTSSPSPPPSRKDGLDELQQQELQVQRQALTQRWQKERRSRHNRREPGGGGAGAGRARSPGGRSEPNWDVDEEVRQGKRGGAREGVFFHPFLYTLSLTHTHTHNARCMQVMMMEALPVCVRLLSEMPLRDLQQMLRIGHNREMAAEAQRDHDAMMGQRGGLAEEAGVLNVGKGLGGMQVRGRKIRKGCRGDRGRAGAKHRCMLAWVSGLCPAALPSCLLPLITAFLPLVFGTGVRG